MKKHFAIRADANPQLGSGHIMRCLSIAKRLRLAGQNCLFICADMSTADVIRASDFEIVSLGSRWNELDGELPNLGGIIRERGIGTLLVDSYFVTESYLSGLCELTRVVYIDDLDSFKYPCHALINYNCYAESLGYERQYSGIPLLLGTKYAPLREEFSGVPYRETVARVKSALITTGGTDPLNVTGRLLGRLAGRPWFSGVKFNVISGGFNSNLDELRRMEKMHKNIRLHVDTGEMARLMRESDIAVSAGGSTMYELCACGVPTVCLSLADNQLPGVRGFSARGIMAYAGDVRENGDACIESICAELERLDHSAEIRAEMSREMKNLVDGNGAERLAKFLIEGEQR